MNRLRSILMASVVVCAVPASPAGAQTQSDPELSLTIDETFTLTLKDKQGRDRRCQVGAPPQEPEQRELRLDLKQGEMSAGIFGHGSEAEALRRLVRGAELRCDRQRVAVSALAAAGKDKTFRSPVPVVAPGYAWQVDDLGERVLRALGATAPGCNATEAKEQPASVNCELERIPNGFRFRLDSPITKGTVKLTFGTGGRTLSIPVRECTFRLTGRVPYLIQGASLQQLTLEETSSNSGCRSALRGPIDLVAGGARIHAVPLIEQYFEGAPPVSTYEVRSVPGDLPPGTQELSLETRQGMLGKLRADVVGAVRASNPIQVDYDVPKEWDRYGHFEAASGKGEIRAADGKIENVLVIDPSAAGKKPAIRNHVTIALPPGLRLESSNPHEFMRDSMTLLQVQRDPRWASVLDDGTAEQRFVWIARALTGHTTEQLHKALGGCTATLRNGILGSGCVLSGSPDRIILHLRRAIPAPVNLSLSLVLIEKQRISWFDDAEQQRPKLIDILRKLFGGDGGAGPTSDTIVQPQTLLDIDVPLAATARHESVPAPLKDMLAIRCKREVYGQGSHRHWLFIRDGDARAIDDEAVRLGECVLKWDYRNVCDGPECDPAGITALYGQQTLLVTVQRGAVKKEKAWVVNPDPSAELRLPVPDDDADLRGIYRVDVRPAASPTAEVVYRASTRDKVLDTLTERERSELAFTATLRPRGLFGFKVLPTGASCRSSPERPDICFRAYVTASAALTGVRFPASRANLARSTAPSAYEFLDPRLGLLLSVEPWSYDRGINPAPLGWIPVQVGAHFVDIGSGDIRLFSAVGTSASYPILEDVSSQLGSKLTLGMFWENDFRGGNHLLVNLSLNVGSLLSGNQKN